MKNLFIGSTPFQIFNISNMVLSKFYNDENDIFILKFSESSVEFYHQLKKSKIFKNVFLIDFGESKNKLMYISHRIEAINNIKKNIPTQKIYDSIFLVCTEIYSKSIYYYYHQINNKIKLYIYEDGTGTYLNVLTLLRKKIGHRILKYKYKFDLIDRCEAVFVYQPRCMIDQLKNIKVEKLPTIVREDILAQKMINLLEIEEEESLFEKWIFFESDFKEKDILNLQNRIEIIIFNIVNKEFCIKKHPNAKKINVNKKIKYIKSYAGFELLNLKKSYENNVLISISSSACVLPKLIFNEEPYVIFLYKLIKERNDNYKKFDKFVKEIKKIYVKKERVKIPNSEKELFEIINELYKNHNNLLL